MHGRIPAASHPIRNKSQNLAETYIVAISQLTKFVGPVRHAPQLCLTLVSHSKLHPQSLQFQRTCVANDNYNIKIHNNTLYMGEPAACLSWCFAPFLSHCSHDLNQRLYLSDFVLVYIATWAAWSWTIWSVLACELD